MRRLALLAVVLAASSAPVLAQDADLVLRTGRLEGQVRQLSGQLEQAQFQNRKLEEQLKKFQADVEFRFQELKPAQKPVAAAPPSMVTGTTVPAHPAAGAGPVVRPPAKAGSPATPVRVPKPPSPVQ
jgi:TolA-binding protein